jgi:hypothetical protein
MLLYILLIVLFLAVIYLLFVPIILYVNTAKEHYFLQIKGLAKASIKADDLEIIKVHLKVAFFNFDFYPLKKISLSNQQKTKKETVKKRSSNFISFKKIWSLIKSFEVKQFRAEIDSGDCVFNSKLYPVFTLLNFYKGTHLSVNFQNRNNVLLFLENRPIRIIRSFINN